MELPTLLTQSTTNSSDIIINDDTYYNGISIITAPSMIFNGSVTIPNNGQTQFTFNPMFAETFTFNPMFAETLDPILNLRCHMKLALAKMSRDEIIEMLDYLITEEVVEG